MGGLRDTFHSLYSRARGIPLEVGLKAYRRRTARILDHAAGLRSAGDGDLESQARNLRERARRGARPDDLLDPTFALVHEAARRELGLSAFEAQIVGALALSQGKIAEMRTGEGKTLVAVFAAAHAALSAQGVHVLTFNDYLARRDAAWMGPVYRRLGLRVDAVQESMDIARRKRAWAADVTYATARECGFDHLRDQLRTDPGDVVHRPFRYAIIDEADSLLIDESRIPLVIAGTLASDELPAGSLTAVVRALRAGEHYETDEYDHNAYLTDAGLDIAEAMLGRGPLHAEANVAVLAALNQALHAEVLLRRDVDYIVRAGKVELVDEFTGRVAQDRRWPDGLQSALEAKEGLVPRPEGGILGSIALQHFLRLYPCSAGMTATARSAAEELGHIYDMPTVVIPPHRPCVRVDHPDQVFTHAAAKQAAVIAEVERVHATGRPVLVGTASVEESEAIAARLCSRGLDCAVLNARNDEQEAELVARAGWLGSVTISTHMAGRGTDIVLGRDAAEHDQVVDLGGLYVLGTHRHESVRIDDQLRGRAGRQGDPGSSRFFVALDDDLMQRYGVTDLVPAAHRPADQDDPVTDPVVLREVDRVQRIVEGQSFEVRKTLFKYSSIVEGQRGLVATRRRDALHGATEIYVEAAPQRYAELVATAGEAGVREAERQISLALIDELWADHLARVADIREGIHLHSLSGSNPFGAGQDPLVAFHREVAAAFSEAWDRLDEAIIDRMHAAHVTSAGVDLQREGLDVPAATWTYIVNDDPFGSLAQRVASRLRNTAAAVRDRSRVHGP